MAIIASMARLRDPASAGLAQKEHPGSCSRHRTPSSGRTVPKRPAAPGCESATNHLVSFPDEPALVAGSNPLANFAFTLGPPQHPRRARRPRRAFAGDEGHAPHQCPEAKAAGSTG